MKQRKRILLCLLSIFCFLNMRTFSASAEGEKYPVYTLLIEYVDALTGSPVADPYKAVLAPDTAYDVASPEVAGYTLADPAQSRIQGILNADVSYQVSYNSTTCPYTITHYLKIGGVYQQDMVENGIGTRGETITVTPPDHPGYTCVTTDMNLALPASGETVNLDLYYDPVNPEEVVLSFVTCGSPVDSISAFSGTDISAQKATILADPPTRTGYTFAGWEPEIPDAMPQANTTITAQWTANPVPYAVYYWYRTLGTTDSYYQIKTVDKTGLPGDTAAYDRIDAEAAPDCYEFEKADDAAVIAADGSTVVNVYYKPIQVTVYVYDRTVSDAINDGVDPVVALENVVVGETINLSGYTELNKETLRQEYLDRYPMTAEKDKVALRWQTYNTAAQEYTYFSEQFMTNDLTIKPNYVLSPESSRFVLIFPDFHPLLFTYYESYYYYNPETDNYDFQYQYMFKDARWGVSASNDKKFPVIPSGNPGYELKYINYSMGMYDGVHKPEMTGPQPALPNADGIPPEQQTYYLYSDVEWENSNPPYPKNYIEFYYKPKMYPLRYVDGTDVLSNAGDYYYNNTPDLDYVPTISENRQNEGYVFAGWYRRGDTEKTIVDKALIQRGNNDYCPKWELKKLNVVFDSNGGSPQPETQIVEKENTASQPQNPVREGYDFNGWRLERQDGGRYDFSLPVEKDINLVAAWKPASTRVNYTVIHQMADGTVLKTDTFTDKLSGTLVTAEALAAEDPLLGQGALPDAAIKMLRLTDTSLNNVIIFTYTPVPQTTYIIRHVDESTGAEISSRLEITDIARIMTASARNIPNYTELQKYGTGGISNNEIILYYRTSKTKNHKPEPGKRVVIQTDVQQTPTSSAWRRLLHILPGCTVLYTEKRRRKNE